jgi:hypothetical protein
MTKYSLKKILLPFHIICGIILLINLISSYFGDFTIYFPFSQIIKYSFLISGGILFFLVKNLKGYFAIYTFSPIVVLVSFIFGLAGLFVVFMMAAIIWPKNIIANTNNYILYSKFSGPMKVPDEFEITERKYFLIEKRLAEFKNNENNEDLKNSDISIVNNLAVIKFTIENKNYQTDVVTKLDTLIKIAIK